MKENFCSSLPENVFFFFLSQPWSPSCASEWNHLHKPKCLDVPHQVWSTFSFVYGCLKAFKMRANMTYLRIQGEPFDQIQDVFISEWFCSSLNLNAFMMLTCLNTAVLKMIYTKWDRSMLLKNQIRSKSVDQFMRHLKFSLMLIIAKDG